MELEAVVGNEQLQPDLNANFEVKMWFSSWYYYDFERIRIVFVADAKIFGSCNLIYCYPPEPDQP